MLKRDFVSVLSLKFRNDIIKALCEDIYWLKLTTCESSCPLKTLPQALNNISLIKEKPYKCSLPQHYD